MSQPYIGILLNSPIYSRIPTGKTAYEYLPFYEEAARKYDLTPCYLRLSDIEPGQEEWTGYVMDKNGGYKQTSISPPKVIHNRSIHFTLEEKKKMSQLVRDGRVIYNFWNDSGKMKPFTILKEEADLLPHLPETVKADEKNIIDMIESHSSLFLKPYSGSLGKGIIKIDKTDNGQLAIFKQMKERIHIETLPINEAITQLIQLTSNRRYIVQKRIPLATYRGNPFDLRVSVQRNETGHWQVTGIVAKVATKGKFLTNVAQGGRVCSFDELLRNLLPQQAQYVYQNVVNLSLKTAECLGGKMRHLADLGLDIGITTQGFPMLIECNRRDLRYSFRDAKMYKTWKNTHVNPIRYASYLLKQGLNQSDSTRPLS